MDGDGQTVDRRRGRVPLCLRARARAASRRSAARARVGGHRGYGLAVMVHILGGILAGRLVLAHPAAHTQGPSDPHNIGHFFMAIDPARLPSRGRVRGGSRPGDRRAPRREASRARPARARSRRSRRWRRARERLQHGVPIPDDLMAQLRDVAKSAGVPFGLAAAGAPAS